MKIKVGREKRMKSSLISPFISYHNPHVWRQHVAGKITHHYGLSSLINAQERKVKIENYSHTNIFFSGYILKSYLFHLQHYCLREILDFL